MSHTLTPTGRWGLLDRVARQDAAESAMRTPTPAATLHRPEPPRPLRRPAWRGARPPESHGSRPLTSASVDGDALDALLAGQVDDLIWVGPQAVAATFGALADRGRDYDAARAVRAARSFAVGAATVQRLRRLGLPPALAAEEPRHLIKALRKTSLVGRVVAVQVVDGAEVEELLAFLRWMRADVRCWSARCRVAA